MKVMDKATIIEEKMVESVLHERVMMARLSYPLVVNLQFATQNEVDLFLVIDLMLGGDVRYHMKSGRSFDPERARFYAAQTALSINYLHEAGYIHRDIKPDNLLLDGQGNVHITDFNLSMRKDDPRRRGVVGTRSYMAPEVVSRHSYDEAVDWWSLGICLYEWTYGTVPFRGSTEEQHQAILRADPRYPSGINKHCKSLLMGLLKKDPKKRLNWQKIKDHPYFAGMDWKALEEKRVDAPWKPDTTRANCDGTFDLDEQFQVKKKRPPVLDDVFGPWDWKPGQDDESLSEGQSTESDGAISDERLTPRTGTDNDSLSSSSDDSGHNGGTISASGSNRTLTVNPAVLTHSASTGTANVSTSTPSASRAASPVMSRHATTEDHLSPDAIDANDDKRGSKRQLKQQQQTAVVVEHPIADVPQGHTSPKGSPQQARKKKNRGSAPPATTEDAPTTKHSPSKAAVTESPSAGRRSSRDVDKVKSKDSPHNSGSRPKSKKKQRDTS